MYRGLSLESDFFSRIVLAYGVLGELESVFSVPETSLLYGISKWRTLEGWASE